MLNNHRSITTRRNMQRAHLIAQGKPLSQPADMLDLYLEGESVADIAAVYEIADRTVRNSICKEALFRLMEQQAVERLEELDHINE